MKKIKLLFDANLLANTFDQKPNGIYFVTINVLEELRKNENVDVSLWAYNSNKLGEFKREKGFENLNSAKIPVSEKINIKINYTINKIEILKKNKRFIKVFFKRVHLFLLQKFYALITPFSKSGTDYDAYLSCMYGFPNFMKYSPARKYLVLHDCIPIVLNDMYSFFKEKDYWFWVACDSLNVTDKCFCISENTKQDFLKYFPELNEQSLIVTPIACASDFRPLPKDENIYSKYSIPLDKKYVFSLCSLEPRKNLIMAVSSFIEFIKKNNIDDMVFVLGGAAWDIFIEELEKALTNLNDYKGKIVKAGYIADEDLSVLYSNAEWFVYTSMFEGFGMPPLEAMSCKCAVITSNNTSLPEVVGDAGIMIDYDSKEQHIAAYEKYYFNKEYKEQMAMAGYERSKQFSWKKCVDSIIKEMESA